MNPTLTSQLASARTDDLRRPAPRMPAALDRLVASSRARVRARAHRHPAA